MVARFEVEDSGIGIAPEVLPRLFRMFEQADASTTRKYGGTGLGLAIVRRLAEAMGGEAGAESAPGAGSTFWFTARLKRSPGAVQDSLRPSSKDLPNFGDSTDIRILLVEDNEINRELALELLRAVGLQALVAVNGRDALEKAQAESIDLILMDVQMPVMDGMEATRRIRRLPGWRDKPIVALTANVFNEDRRACLEAGMNDFVTKPVQPAQFHATLARWLPKAPPAMTVPSIATRDATLPAIDGVDVAEGVRRMNGDANAYSRLVRRFAELHDSDIRQIRECLARSDAEGAALIAHTLRGAAGNIGATGLADAARRLEAVLNAREDAAVVEAALGDAEAGLASLVRSIVASCAREPFEREGGVDPSALRRALAELEAALAASDVQARDIMNASASALRLALGPAYDELRRQVSDYLFPQARETLQRFRRPLQ